MGRRFMAGSSAARLLIERSVTTRSAASPPACSAGGSSGGGDRTSTGWTPLKNRKVATAQTCLVGPARSSLRKIRVGRSCRPLRSGVNPMTFIKRAISSQPGALGLSGWSSWVLTYDTSSPRTIPLTSSTTSLPKIGNSNSPPAAPVARAETKNNDFGPIGNWTRPFIFTENCRRLTFRPRPPTRIWA